MGDARLTKRTVQIAEQMALLPGKSVPQMFDSLGDIKATYHLFGHPSATLDALQSKHRKQVLTALSGPRIHLLIEDTSEFSWSGNDPIEGLGPIGSGSAGLQGFHLHSTLAVKWPEPFEPEEASPYPPVELVGLADQIFYRPTTVARSTPEGKAPRT